MKNKEGFTLIELLAVVLILGILSLIAVPNVISIIDNNKKDMVLSDARKLISQAKFQVNIDKDIRDSASYNFTFAELNVNNDIKTEPDSANNYDSSSYVNYKINDSGVATYCVYLKGSKRQLGTQTTCVEEKNLFDRSKVTDITD